MSRGRKSGTDPDSRMARTRHIPVLLSEVLEALQPKAGETYIDGTFGAGGYSTAILEAADCKVLALDRDGAAVRAAEAIVARYPERLRVVESRFSEIEQAAHTYLLTTAEPGQPLVFMPPDGVVLDIGVSSMQIDEAERGFSFMRDGPLDMRMSGYGLSALDVVNSFEEERIANIIYEFGEERRSRAIARAIVAARAEIGIARTRQLADIVLRVFHGRMEDGRHPATRTFQALRMFVNDELGELRRGLEAAERLLIPGGRLVVVTFHSLEDRIVKQFLARRSGKTVNVSRYLPQRLVKVSRPSFRILNSRPLTPQKGELDLNPRARSARLRAAIRTEAAAWSAGEAAQQGS